ncbi:MAG: tRNA pseudouridine(13) synthase TruD [Candidatus Micrarchaeia archaeon]
MYTIKKNAADFIVDEILRDGTLVSESCKYEKQTGGRFVWIGIRKVNWNTIDLALEIARRLRISEKRVNYAGIKDRVAVAYQIFSVNTDLECEKVRAILGSIKDIEVISCWRYNRWVKNEDFVGNRFEIVLRECNFKANEINMIDKFPNYFGEQRFGSMRGNSHIVGMCLLRKDYEGAIREYLSGELGEKERKMYELSKKYGPEKFVKTYWRVFKLCLNAVQSQLFNEELDMRIRDRKIGVLKGEYSCGRNEFGFADVNVEGSEFTVVQLMGSRCVLNEYKEMLLEKYGFNIKDFETFGLKGGFRTLYTPVVELSVMDCGDRCVKLGFRIQKGAYATALLKEICK